MTIYNATLVAQIFNLIILMIFLFAIGYALYSIIVKIPRTIKENNEQLLNKLDKIAEALEKQKRN